MTKTGVELGVFGQIHPLTAQNYGISAEMYAGVLDFDLIWENADTKINFKPLSKFPTVTRDFSFVCDDGLEIGKIEDIITHSAGKLLNEVKLFDIYRSEQIGKGKKSVAFRLVLRADDHTLTDDETEKITNKVLNDLKYKLGIGIRE